jgi:peptide/nickel transport system permease protein
MLPAVGGGSYTTTQETIDYMMNLYGLDKPLYVQFYLFLVNSLQGQFGISISYNVPVMDIVLERFVNSLYFVGLATILSIVIGVGVGIVAAWFRGKWLDKLSVTLSLGLYSMPAFWLGMVLIFLFAVQIPLFPTSGMYSSSMIYGNPGIFERGVDLLSHLVLPATTLAAVYIGQYAMIMRSSLVDVLSEDYIMTAKAKGLGSIQILRDHALKNAALPTITLIAINVGMIAIGAVGVETVFNYPGIGRLIFDAINNRDYILLQGAFLIFVVFMVVANFFADILYAVLDPRVRYD